MLSLTCYVFLRIFPFLCCLFTTGKRCRKHQNCKKHPMLCRQPPIKVVCVCVCADRCFPPPTQCPHRQEPSPCSSALEHSLGRGTLPRAPGPVLTHAGISTTEVVPQAQAASRSGMPGLCMNTDSFLLCFVSSVTQKSSQPTPAPYLTARSLRRF